MHEVRLLPRAKGDYVLLGIMQDEEEARRLGQAVAELLRLPCTLTNEAEESGEEADS